MEMEEAYYNEKNTPSLNSALILDTILQTFSKNLAEGKEQKYPKQKIDNEEDLNKIMQILNDDYIRPRKFEEFFQFDCEGIKKKFKLEWEKKFTKTIEDKIISLEKKSSYEIFKKDNDEILAELIEKNCTTLGSKKMGATFDFEVVFEKFKDSHDPLTLDHLSQALNFLNKKWMNNALKFIEEALKNIRGEIHYKFIQCNRRTITHSNSLTSPYFSILPNGLAAANNGILFLSILSIYMAF